MGGLSFSAPSVGAVPLYAGPGVDAQVSQGRVNFATGMDLENVMIWSEGTVVSFEDDLSDDGRFGILHMGADWQISSGLIIGVAVQVDSYNQDLSATDSVSGLGWMIGPVATARVAEGLFIDARLAFGQADNTIEDGTGSTDFDTRRALAEIALVGQMGFADMVAVYSFLDEGVLSTGSFGDNIEGWSGALEFGLNYATRSGMRIEASVGFGGLFSDANSVSVGLGLHVPL